MRLLLALLVAVFVVSGGQALADVYDEVWIKQCIEDNRYQGQTSETIRIYCVCMNDQMSSGESRSITEWEKTHPEELEYCAGKAGWKGR